MLTEKATECKVDGAVKDVQNQLTVLVGYVRQAAEQGTSEHEVEKHLFRGLLAMGYQLLCIFFQLVGPGDCGEKIVVEGGQGKKRILKRLPKMLTRHLLTVFGKFTLKRWCYGTRPGQKVELIPTDQQLQLPELDASYMMQELNQMLATEHAFGTVSEDMKTFLGFKQPVDTLERGNRQMAEAAAAFCKSRPAPQAENEGEFLVASVDNKGVPMARPTEALPAGGHRKKGEKANKKQMACIGSVYTVDPNIRTPEELIASLFHDPDRPRSTPPPNAQQKIYWAALTREENGVVVNAQAEVYQSMNDNVTLRRKPGQIMIHLTDGQISLETDRRKYLPRDKQTVDILDLMHVISRLWEAAYLFHAEGSYAASQFARELLLRVLQGKAGRVIGRLRRMGTVKKLRGAKAKRLATLCRFMEKNLHRMRYDEYLQAGYPIATGVIEGACRHVIKDRMERAGMRWKIPGAQAMLQLRAIRASGDWQAFQDARIQYETARLYPHRHHFQNLIAGNLTL